MSDPIRLTIRGRGDDTDAPTVEDLLAQVADWFAIFKGVEQAIAPDGASEIEWRVTNASKNSPLAFEVTPYPRTHGMDIERRVREVKEYTSAGLAQLRARAERPSYFTPPVLENAQRLFARVTNGLDLTEVDFGDDIPPVTITPPDARTASANVTQVRRPAEKPYREVGSVDATLQSVERDGYGRAIIHAKLRLNGDTVKCVLSDEAQGGVEGHTIADVWKNQRIRVVGTIHYRAVGHITQILCDQVQFLRPRSDLPSADDIINTNFTGGLSSEEYLERLRSGQLS